MQNDIMNSTDCLTSIFGLLLFLEAKIILETISVSQLDLGLASKYRGKQCHLKKLPRLFTNPLTDHKN